MKREAWNETDPDVKADHGMSGVSSGSDRCLSPEHSNPQSFPFWLRANIVKAPSSLDH